MPNQGNPLVSAFALATARTGAAIHPTYTTQAYQGSWVTPSPTNYARAHWRTAEKISGLPRGIKIPAFLPFFDDQTGETATMRLYYRRMLADPVVKSALMGKIFAVSQLDLQIHPADKKNPTDKEVAEFCQWVLTERIMGGFDQLVWNILIGELVDGISVVEPVWRVEDQADKWLNKWVIADQKAKDIDNDIVLLLDEFRNIVGIMGLRYNSGDYFDPGEFIIARHMKFLEAPGGMSDFRAVYSRYWILDTAWKLRAVGLERRSMPVLKGIYATASQKPSLENALSMARYNNWISAPAGAQIEVLDIAGRSQDEFRNAIQDLREEIFLGVQGATLQALTGGQGQERGNSKVHESTANLLKYALAKQVCNLLNNHECGVLKKLARLNYGKVDLPRATMDAVDDMELAQSLPVDNGLHMLGIDLSKEQLREKYRRLPPQDEEDTLPGVPQQPPPGAGGIPGMPPGAPPGMGPEGPPPEMGGLPEQGGMPEEIPPGEEELAQQPTQPMPEQPQAPQFADQNLFTGKLRLFAEEAVARWNSMEPSDAEVRAAGKLLDRSGLVIYATEKGWRLETAKQFNPERLRAAV